MSKSTGQKVWLVTGASSGLGLALVRRVIARGDLAVATARDTSRTAQALADIDANQLHILRLDLLWPFVKLQKTMELAVARWGRIDCLVNNAGHLDALGPSEETGAENFMRYMEVNLAGMINVTNAVLPYMRARRDGTVAIVGSRSVYRNEIIGISAYAASKAAQHSYGETLAAELKQFGIRVLIIAPGTFQTAFSSPAHHPNTISDYTYTHQNVAAMLNVLKNAEGSDLVKGMDVVVDVVRGEGRAQGKDGFPLWLVLGEEAIANVRERATKLLATLDTWGDVGSRLAKEKAKL